MPICASNSARSASGDISGHPATESASVGVRGVGADADPEARSSARDGGVHDRGVAGMGAGGDVRAGHDLEQPGLEQRGVVDLADVRIEVDGSRRNADVG